jgi:hypothetical protein
MRYESVQRLSDEDLTGVERSTFARMLEVVEQGLRNFAQTAQIVPDRSAPADFDVSA